MIGAYTGVKYYQIILYQCQRGNLLDHRMLQGRPVKTGDLRRWDYVKDFRSHVARNRSVVRDSIDRKLMNRTRGLI